MGCFPSKHTRKRNASFKPQQSSVSLVQDQSKTLISPSLQQLQDKTEEQLSVSTRKKVTFDSNVQTYEPDLPDEVLDFSPEKKNEEGEKEEALAKQSGSKSSSSEDSSVTSTGSYPSNHRYQNCRDSDDEEEIEDWESEISDEDESDGIEGECELGVEFEEDEMAYSRSRRVINDAVEVDHVFTEEVESPIPICERDVKSIGFNSNARDRSVYVHPVLNPVENLSQWKVVKAKRTIPLRPLKENNVCSNSNHESQVAFGVKEVSETETPKKLNREIAVDASLSNWLASSETTPVNKACLYGGGVAATPDRSASQQGSNSVISHEDRPILGALTLDEIKQFSATSSPRKSPCRSPDEMPIIGTVGSYWNFTGSAEDSASVSSFKGIPNTTSKYREDKKVTWHATPFETRLEKALNRGAAEAASTCVPHVF
uniref:Protein JASON n=2 Tax=Cicer arietinum TaxID=3827 RepID=A0A1S2XV85_CICAR|nr:protein JASON [Cicer arietinum]